jgi:hypothetical protein
VHGRWTLTALLKGGELFGRSRPAFWTVVDLANSTGYAPAVAMKAPGAPRR